MATFEGVKTPSVTVNSYTQITATVPNGTKTGRIGVTTPGGTATSVGHFHGQLTENASSGRWRRCCLSGLRQLHAHCRPKAFQLGQRVATACAS
jgi:hypothetical protein